MRKDTVVQLRQPGTFSEDPLTEVLRLGARRLLARAVEMEVTTFVEMHADLTDGAGRRRIVRHGYLPEREIQTGIGPVAVRCPRVRDRGGGEMGPRIRFTSSILPPYLRRAKSIEELLPWLYLKGISTGDFSEALAALLGPEAPGLSASTIVRLKEVWQGEMEHWQRRDLSARRYVYFWADGIYFSPRLDDKQCILVIIGADELGRKELLAIADGYRESAQSWREVLLDLKRRGLPLGPRRLVQKAARELIVEPATTAPAAAQHDAERRQITVMFCDLVGSTPLAEALDPEDLRSLMQAYQKACCGAVERYAGQVAQYLGDGLMIYFGWPRAHEDDATRAVLAALAIVEAVKSVAAPSPLQVRIGIATGPVVVGETARGDAAVPKLAVGDAPNLASRLEGLAGPDETVISPTTHRLVGGAVDCTDLGEQTLRGILEPVRAWRVLGPGAASGRFEAAHPGPLSAIVGRDTEIALLMDRWELAGDGEGQVVLLGGEPGIGKSRIVQAIMERLADQPHTRLRYQCSPDLSPKSTLI